MKTFVIFCMVCFVGLYFCLKSIVKDAINTKKYEKFNNSVENKIVENNDNMIDEYIFRWNENKTNLIEKFMLPLLIVIFITCEIFSYFIFDKFFFARREEFYERLFKILLMAIVGIVIFLLIIILCIGVYIGFTWLKKQIFKILCSDSIKIKKR